MESLKKILYSKTIFVSLLCILFLFTSCGKEKVVEKLIYGETVTKDDIEGNGNNENNGNTENNSVMLSKDKFNSIAITREFNNIEDFFNYINQCHTNKIRLNELKFKIRGPFTVINQLSYPNDSSFYGEHYIYKRISISFSNPYRSLSINLIDTDLNSNISSVDEIIFIVGYTNYYYDDSYNKFMIEGYSYLQ